MAKSCILSLLFCLALCLWTVAVQSAEPGEIDAIPVGSLEIWAISDAEGKNQMSLLPDIDKYPEFKGLFSNGTIPATFQTFYLKNGDRQILFDAGWGHEQKTAGHTVDALMAKGVRPEDITDVILTHMDQDHIGGLTRNGQAVFPNAIIRVSGPELKAWQEGSVSARPEQAIARARQIPQIYNGRIKTFSFGEEILPGITAVDASGHTPGHTAYDIKSGNDRFTIAGDVMHAWQVQLQKPELSSVYDMDKTKAAQTRQTLLQRAAERNDQFAGMHFPVISTVKNRPDGGFMMREPR